MTHDKLDAPKQPDGEGGPGGTAVSPRAAGRRGTSPVGSRDVTGGRRLSGDI